MKIILSKRNLNKILSGQRNLGYVPTMGAIHNGHVSLIKKSLNSCEKTIVTIFVNKPQFNRKDDYMKYPRNLSKDISILKKNKVNYLFLPKLKQIYPNGPNRKIKIIPFGKDLCGKFRPGHFEAVVDVIERFIEIIKPKKIFFGKKDLQQLIIVKEFIKKKGIKTKVIGCKIIREKKGIPLSSRNLLLSKNEKTIASNIYKLLVKEKNNLINKKTSLKKIKRDIFILGANKIDYIKIININELIIPTKRNKKQKIFIAYYLGSTRLIDNI